MCVAVQLSSSAPPCSRLHLASRRPTPAVVHRPSHVPAAFRRPQDGWNTTPSLSLTDQRDDEFYTEVPPPIVAGQSPLCWHGQQRLSHACAPAPAAFTAWHARGARPNARWAYLYGQPHHFLQAPAFACGATAPSSGAADPGVAHPKP